MLRRKPAFQQLNLDVTKSYPVVLICRHPKEDYCPVPGNACVDLRSTAWVGECRKRQNRRLAVVQEVKNAGLLDLKCLAQIAAPNVARVHALYHQDNRFFAAYEYIDLDITEIGPLSDKEIASVFLQVRALLIVSLYCQKSTSFAESLQVLRGIQRLLILSIGFRIESVRANSNGDVKIGKKQCPPLVTISVLTVGSPRLELRAIPRTTYAGSRGAVHCIVSAADHGTCWRVPPKVDAVCFVFLGPAPGGPVACHNGKCWADS